MADQECNFPGDDQRIRGFVYIYKTPFNVISLTEANLVNPVARDDYCVVKVGWSNNPLNRLKSEIDGYKKNFPGKVSPKIPGVGGPCGTVPRAWGRFVDKVIADTTACTNWAPIEDLVAVFPVSNHYDEDGRADEKDVRDACGTTILPGTVTLLGCALVDLGKNQLGWNDELVLMDVTTRDALQTQFRTTFESVIMPKQTEHRGPNPIDVFGTVNDLDKPLREALEGAVKPELLQQGQPVTIVFAAAAVAGGGAGGGAGADLTTPEDYLLYRSDGAGEVLMDEATYEKRRDHLTNITVEFQKVIEQSTRLYADGAVPDGVRDTLSALEAQIQALLDALRA